jgi:hypothetical protein
LFDGDLGFALGPHGDPGLAQPVWSRTAARMAARSWLAASTSTGSVRLAGVVNSAQRRPEPPRQLRIL